MLGAEGYYPKLNNKWWDGYQSQKVVIMEDVDKETVSSFTTTSRFGRTAGVHWRDQGGAVAPIHRWLVVTSNYSIMDILKDLEDRQLREAITRRFMRFEMLSRDEIKNWDTYETVTPEAVAAIFK